MTDMKKFRTSRLPHAVLCLLSACLLAALSAQAQTYTVLYNFGQSETDASFPNGELIQDPAGNIYGTTYAGGSSGAGTVFEVDTNGQEAILYSFTGGTDGAAPEAGLFRDPKDGSLYGTTTGGDFMGSEPFSSLTRVIRSRLCTALKAAQMERRLPIG